jgi:hypothetical protein
MYWTAKNFQYICVNRPSATLHEDSVMAPKLPREHRVDVNRMFLTTLNIYICVCVCVCVCVCAVISFIGPKRMKRGRIRRGY